jgi:hypothetical protein
MQSEYHRQLVKTTTIRANGLILLACLGHRRLLKFALHKMKM